MASNSCSRSSRRPDQQIYVLKQRRSNIEISKEESKNTTRKEKGIKRCNSAQKSITTKNKNYDCSKKFSNDKFSPDRSKVNHIDLKKTYYQPCFKKGVIVLAEKKFSNTGKDVVVVSDIRRTLFGIEHFSDMFSHMILNDASRMLQELRNNIKVRSCSAQINVNILYKQKINKLHHSIADNIVNIAIENAMKMLISVAKCYHGKIDCENLKKKNANIEDLNKECNNVYGEKDNNKKHNRTRLQNFETSRDKGVHNSTDRAANFNKQKGDINEDNNMSLLKGNCDAAEKSNTGSDLQIQEEITDDWDSSWTEEGECINEELRNELSRLTCKNDGERKSDVISYLEFEPKEIMLDAGEFGHILELHNFSSAMKTQDLFFALTSLGIKDCSITWVDDTHALAVFANQNAAHTAMRTQSPLLEIRQVIDGTSQSRLKARDFKDVLLPYKKRPETSSLVAHNLVTGALGIKSKVTAEQRKKEREKLKEAKGIFLQRKIKAKQKRDMWENPE
ncbi:uncharacterized protein LOC130645013 isoform X2 [Hydractinia symbiolongicarpus]|uniref:uncharacterized protein LOC130645013 isoform X2 n=1 Tax=Hydractinia symbiolongicarpus TaxID=13093 RepID=UPI00254F4460|nr:uncharacterized protein LOC130645013 isoform X2 [Hydractinia symbiolongicarpus]